MISVTSRDVLWLPQKCVCTRALCFRFNRAGGRVRGNVVEGSKSTEFYLAPDLQFTVAPQFVIEGSVQMPVVRNTGPMVLRTDLNVLAGIKYLF